MYQKDKFANQEHSNQNMEWCSVHRRKRKFSRKGTHNQFRTWCQGSLRASGNYVVLNMLDREEHSFMTRWFRPIRIYC